MSAIQTFRSIALRAVLLAATLAASLAAHAAPLVEVFKSPTCGCCTQWVAHLRENGFEVRAHDVEDVGAARARVGMPDRYASCHSARVEGYAIEGHVPAADIRRLLKERPAAVGLAVPSMPPGSPGMEGERKIPYDTLLVGQMGTARVYARH